ncbi:hypothetical protein J4E80_004613 [Alternaria sp. BMP 0032]|nr:hypothetical protein J4E80_004613 [Alternaria sp. BMP 0032]
MVTFGTNVNVPSKNFGDWFTRNLTSQHAKTRLMRRARKRLGNKYQHRGICGVCGVLERVWKKLDNDQIDKHLQSVDTLEVPKDFMAWHQRTWAEDPEYQDKYEKMFSVEGMPILKNKFIEKAGVVGGRLQMCEGCFDHLGKKNTRPPKQSYANFTFTGEIPEELACLSEVEQMAIASRRALQAMFWLKRTISDDLKTRQRASSGHWLAFTHNYGEMATRVMSLPLTADVLADSIQVNLVNFKGKSDTFRQQLSVDPQKLFRAFKWLKRNNPLYEDLVWDEEAAKMYDGGIPESIIMPAEASPSPDAPSDKQPSATPSSSAEQEPSADEEPSADQEYLDDEAAASVEEDDNESVDGNEASITEQDLVDAGASPEADVDRGVHGEQDSTGDGSEREPFVFSRSTISLMDHTGLPVTLQRSNELCDENDPKHLPSILPVLYPLGVGGCNPWPKKYESDPHLPYKLSFQEHIRLLLRRGPRFIRYQGLVGADKIEVQGAGFADHPFFLPLTANTYLRMETRRLTCLRCNSAYGQKAAELISKLDAATLDAVLDPKRENDASLAQYRKAFEDLVRAVRAITGNVIGTAQSRRNSRDEIWGMIHKYGRPAFWCTISPPEGHSRLMVKLCGGKIDLEKENEEIKEYTAKVRAALAANNPVASAQYFDIMVNVVTDVLIGNGTHKGLFGYANGHYGTVETNQHGGLHLHFLVWLKELPKCSDLMEKLNLEGMKDAELEAWITQYVDGCCTNGIDGHLHRTKDEEAKIRSDKLRNGRARADLRRIATRDAAQQLPTPSPSAVNEDIDNDPDAQSSHTTPPPPNISTDVDREPHNEPETREPEPQACEATTIPTPDSADTDGEGETEKTSSETAVTAQEDVLDVPDVPNDNDKNDHECFRPIPRLEEPLDEADYEDILWYMKAAAEVEKFQTSLPPEDKSPNAEDQTPTPTSYDPTDVVAKDLSSELIRLDQYEVRGWGVHRSTSARTD